MKTIFTLLLLILISSYGFSQIDLTEGDLILLLAEKTKELDLMYEKLKKQGGNEKLEKKIKTLQKSISDYQSKLKDSEIEISVLKDSVNIFGNEVEILTNQVIILNAELLKEKGIKEGLQKVVRDNVDTINALVLRNFELTNEIKRLRDENKELSFENAMKDAPLFSFFKIKSIEFRKEGEGPFKKRNILIITYDVVVNTNFQKVIERDFGKVYDVDYVMLAEFAYNGAVIKENSENPTMQIIKDFTAINNDGYYKPLRGGGTSFYGNYACIQLLDDKFEESGNYSMPVRISLNKCEKGKLVKDENNLYIILCGSLLAGDVRINNKIGMFDRENEHTSVCKSLGF